MSWLALAFALEIGVLPNNVWTTYDPPATVIERPEFYQQFEARVMLWQCLFAGGSMRIYDWMEEGQLNFKPNGAAFTFEVGLSFKSLEFGFRHWCGVHPITPYLEQTPARVGPEGGYEEVYLKLTGSTRR
jgi:hypothetical protein